MALIRINIHVGMANTMWMGSRELVEAQLDQLSDANKKIKITKL